MILVLLAILMIQMPKSADRCDCCGSPFPRPHAHRNCAGCGQADEDDLDRGNYGRKDDRNDRNNGDDN